ncbi:MAG: MaoC family dehydratase [Pseudomonadota bacterium]
MSKSQTTGKQDTGNFFEDFEVGATLVHATPRTITGADVALTIALYGNRFVVPCAQTFARAIGYPEAPLDDMLVFHVVFGKTVPDISLNAIANLGYADCRFHQPVYPGDTVSVTSEVIGLKENSNGKTGVVYVRTRGVNAQGEDILSFVRWVMVRKRDAASPAPEPQVPDLPDAVAMSSAPQHIAALDMSAWSCALSGAPHRYGDFAVGERIDHVDGTTIEEAEHQLATRLYQNTAKVHFNQHTEGEGRFGRRLIYGGHIISIARALSFNGLANAFNILAINAGQHVAPCFAGDTVYAWSQVRDMTTFDNCDSVGALRMRTVAVKNRNAADFPDRNPDGSGKPAEGVVLDLDYWVAIPR